MIFKHRDGEFRIYDGTATPYYIEVLFTNADLTFPIARNRGEEMLNMNRSHFDSDSSYSLGSDEPIMEPLPISITCILDDTTNTGYLLDMIKNCGNAGSTVNSHVLVTTKGTSSVTNGVGVAVTTPAFADTKKATFDLEVLWDGTVDMGWKLQEVYFTPTEQTITESEENITFNMSGLIYGAITPITAFTAGTTIQS